MVAFCPRGELGLNRRDDFLELGEISIVQTTPTSEFPDSFDRIQLGTVRRKEVQSESGCLLLAPVLMEPRVVILGIVGDDYNPAAASNTGAPQSAKKAEKCGAIELVLFPAKYKTAITQPDRAKIPHALTGGGVQQDRVFDFWRNPHSTTRTVLLEMHFIGGPQVH